MNTKFFIPDNVKVGFQNREGTYTGRLAYVVGVDKKGIRKETSWEGWRDKKIKAEDYQNEPTEGFVLNKNGGGRGSSYHSWNPRQAFIRVFDPRNFEFEISVANLILILRETGCDPGKGLDGKFVYAWDRDKLVLLPVKSQEYINSKNYTKLQAVSVKAKELILGATYKNKREEVLTYLGRFERHGVARPADTHRYDGGPFAGVVKEHVFIDNKGRYIFLSSLKTIAAVANETPVGNYAELVEKYYRSQFGSKIVKFFAVEKSEKTKPHHHYYSSENFVYEENDVYVLATSHYGYADKDGVRSIETIQTSYRYFFKDGMATREKYEYFARNPRLPRGYYSYYHSSRDKGGTMNWREPTNLELWVQFESGTRCKLENLGHQP